MADEITVSTTMSAAKDGSGSITTPRLAFQCDMAGSNLVGGLTQDIGTSAEAITFGDISGAPAQVVFKNEDATNFVLIGFTNPPTEIKLFPGEDCRFRPTTGTIYAKADTGACRISKWAA